MSKAARVIAIILGILTVRAHAGAPSSVEWNVFLKSWHVIGPFEKEKDGNEGLETDYVGGEAGAQQLGEVTFLGSTYHWRSVEQPVLNFQKVFNARSNITESVAYAWTTITSAEEQDAVLALSVDDGVYAWLNGHRILAQFQDRPCYLDDLKVPVHLQAGENVLVLKVDNSGADWGVMARLLPASANRPVLTFEWGQEPPVGTYEIYSLPDLTIEFVDAEGTVQSTHHTSGFRAKDQQLPLYSVYLPAPETEPAKLRVSFHKSGYEAFLKDVPWEEARRGTITLRPVANAVLSGVVLDAETRKPIQGAVFRHPQNVLPGTTDVEGKFEFKNVDPLLNKLTVAAAGYVSVEKNIRVPADSLEIRLMPGGRVFRGQVLDDQGQPVAGARVRLFWVDGEPRAVTDQQGRFEITGIASRNSQFQPAVEHPDYAPLQPEPERFGAVETKEVTYRLQRGTIITGRVTAKEDGQPLPGIRIVIGEGALVWPEATTDADGRYRIKNAPLGTRLIHALSDDLAPGGGSVTTRSDEETEKNFELEHGADVSGTVTDIAGHPLSAAWVMAETWNGSRVFDRRTYTDRDGHYALHNMPATGVALWVYHPQSKPIHNVSVVGGERRDFTLETPSQSE